ncbi:MAG: hypothetical protein R3F11_22215 [Verrucomicrobiales bacterium]
MKSPRFSALARGCLPLALAALMLPRAMGVDWKLEDVTEPRWFERLGPRCIAIDSSGHPRVAYGGSGLFYGRWDGSALAAHPDRSLPGAGAEASIMLGALDSPVIAYYDSGTRALKLASFQLFPSPGWQIEVIDASASAGYYNSLALGPGGEPHIAYSVATGRKLRHAVKTGGVWVKEDVDTAPYENFVQPSITVDSAGKVAIAYNPGGSSSLDFDGPILLAEKPPGGAWAISSLTGAGAQSLYRPSLCRDSLDRLHLAYHPNDAGGLRYRRGGDQLQPLGNARSPSAAAGPDNRGAIAFINGTTGKIEFANWVPIIVGPVDAGYWDGGTTGQAASFVCQPPSAPGHLAFYDEANRQLKYDLATDAAAPQVIDTAVSQGSYCSVAIDANDRPQALFWDDDNEQVRHAYHTGTAWAFRNFGTPGTVNRQTAFGVDSAGIPHILYREEPSGLLKYATWNARLGLWLTEPVAGAENVSLRRTSLAFDGSDRPHILYSDFNDATFDWELKYATRGDAGWSADMVDAHADSPDFAIAVSAAGLPRLAYRTYGVAGSPLRYAIRFFDGWLAEDVDSGSFVGEGVNLAIGPSGQPHLLYRTGREILRYKWFADSAWHTRDLVAAASAVDPGAALSLAIDSNGLSHAAFQDTAAGDLRYLKFLPATAGFLLIENIDAPGDTGAFPDIALDRSDGAHLAYFSGSLHALEYAYQPASPLTLEVTTITRPGPTTATLRWRGITRDVRILRSTTLAPTIWQQVAGPLAGSVWTDTAAPGERYFYRLVYP